MVSVKPWGKQIFLQLPGSQGKRNMLCFVVFPSNKERLPVHNHDFGCGCVRLSSERNLSFKLS